MSEIRVPAAGVDHPVALALVTALTTLREVADPSVTALWQMADAECLRTLLTLQQVEAVVAGLRLQLLGAMDERQVTNDATHLKTAQWLNATNKQSLHSAHRDLALARGLHKRFPLVNTALAAGTMSSEQAAAIIGVLKNLPDDLDTDQLAQAEQTMVTYAQDFGPKDLKTLSRKVLEVIAPDIAERAEAEALERDDAEARKTQKLNFHPEGPFMRISGKLPRADGEALREVIDAIAKGKTPTTRTDPNDTTPAAKSDTNKRTGASATTAPGGPAASDSGASGGPAPAWGGPSTSAATEGSWVDAFADAAHTTTAGSDTGTDSTGAADTWETFAAGDGLDPQGRPLMEPRPSIEVRRAQGLMTLLHAYLAGGTGPSNGGDRPRVTVVIDYDALLSGLSGATLLGSGDRISPSEARRLACDADILPAIFNSKSQLMDMGRTKRLFEGDLRQAIIMRDRGCVFPGCQRPPRDCDIHHLIPWWHFGETAYDNGAVVCPTHHRLVEPDPPGTTTPDHLRWHMRMSKDGIPEVIPPSDPYGNRTPQRHNRFLLPR